MKSNRIVLFFVLMVLSSYQFAVAEKKVVATWSNDSQAIYDLLMAQMQNARTDYSSSVDTLVRFAKQQKDARLIAKAYRALLQTQRYAEAVDMAKLWMSYSPQNAEIFYVWALVLNKEVDKAIDEIKKQLGKTTANRQRAVLFGYVKVMEGRWYHPVVLDVVRRLYTDYPDNVAVSKVYVGLLRSYGETDKAVRVIDKWLFTRPKNLDLLQEKSDSYRYALRLESAEKVWQDALRDYPNNSDFLFSYAQFLYGIYDFRQAEKVLRKIKKEDTGFAVSLLKMQAMVHLKKYKKAQDAFNWQALDDEQKHRARYGLGVALLDEKQNALAEKNFQKVGENSELALQAAVGIGQIKYTESLVSGNQWFAKIQQQYRLNQEAFLREKAFAMTQAGREKAALSLYDQFLVKNPKNADIRYARALFVLDTQLDGSAVDDLKRLHARAPERADLQNALGYTLLGQTGYHDIAARLIKKALLSDPHNTAVIDSMGWAKYQAKEYKQALPYFRHVYGQSQDGEVVGHYIVALWAAGEKATAKKLYRLEIKNRKSIKKIKQITHHLEKELKQ